MVTSVTFVARWRVYAAVLLVAPALGAGPSEQWAEGPVQVGRVYRPDLLGLVRGDAEAPFRLSGIETVDRRDGPLLARALADVRAWLDAESVRLVSPRRNARDELEGQLRFPDGTWLSERVLAHGHGLLVAAAAGDPVFPRLRLAQLAGHDRKRGLWKLPRQRSEDVRRASGRFGRVCGNASVIQRDPEGLWNLYLGDSFLRRQLTAKIARERDVAFARPDERWLRHDLCVVGRVEAGAAGPEVVLVDPMQIEDRGGLRAR